ncbi:thioredoxin family protein [Chloroflexota bacterium]
MEINLLGEEHEVSVDVQGRLKTNIELSSADDKLSLSLKEGTTVLDKDGELPDFLHVEINLTPPPPPEDAHIVGAVYDLRPHGATFNPPLNLTLSYDPGEPPQGVREGDVYIACYEDDKWDIVRYKQVDTERHTVTTQIGHLARYAVLMPRKQEQGITKPSTEPDPTSIPLEQALSSGKPTLAEFGRGICIPCKAMKPILEELAAEYEGKLNVVIVEIDDHMDQTKQYGIMAIPTQIFFDSSGNEQIRHMGFLPKEEVITELRKIGIE